jgi:transposase
MAKPILDDRLWKRIEPLLPPPKPRRFRYPGRKPVENRAALTGILFVLRTGIGWEYLPQEMGCGSGMTCWRRLRDWQAAGVWDKIHRTLLHELSRADQIDWSRAAVDSASVRAVGGAKKPGRTRRTAARRARSTISSPTRKAFRSPTASRPRTATT